jgi:pullulanase
MTTTADIQKHLAFLPTEELFVGYQISGNANGDTWKNILVLLNGSDKARTVNIPKGEWTVVLEGDVINEGGIRKVSGETVEVPRIGALILVQE